jgi:hypothetical protein
MEYSKIIAITGLTGLYELISSKSDGGIVRSLEDKTTRFVSSRVHQFSHLESIEVYTNRHNENLVTILKAMEASNEKLPDEKDPAALKAYFEKVYPDLDHSRVYSSDLKKMIRWFAVLQANKVEIKLSEPVAEAVEEEAESEQKPAGRPAKKEVKEKQEPVKEVKKVAKAKKPVKKASAEKEKTEKPTKKEPAKQTAAPKTKDEKKAAPGEKPKASPAKKKSK